MSSGGGGGCPLVKTILSSDLPCLKAQSVIPCYV